MCWNCVFHLLLEGLYIVLLALAGALIIQVIRIAQEFIGILSAVRRTTERVEYITDFRNWSDIVKGWFTRKK